MTLRRFLFKVLFLNVGTSSLLVHLKFFLIVHTFQLSLIVHRHYKKRNCNSFNIVMVPVRFANFWSSQYEVIQWRESEHKSWQYKSTSWVVWVVKSSPICNFILMEKSINNFHIYRATHRHLGLYSTWLDHRLVLFA